MNVAFLPDECEVAVVGAGPYGLAVAAHLKAAGLGTRAFGDPMSSWRNSMPKGMKLLSPWNATHIADPAKRFSLDRFWHQHALERQEQFRSSNSSATANGLRSKPSPISTTAR